MSKGANLMYCPRDGRTLYIYFSFRRIMVISKEGIWESASLEMEGAG